MKKIFLLAMACSILSPRVFGSALHFSESSNLLTVENGIYQFEYQLKTGFWDLKDAQGKIILKNAYARAVLLPAHSKTARVLNSAGPGQRSFQKTEISDQLGAGMELKIKCKREGAPALISIFRFYDRQRFITIQLELSEIDSEDEGDRAKILEPMSIKGPEGILVIGENSRGLKILDNGFNWYLDFLVHLHPAGSPPPFPASLFTSESRADWSSVIYDPGSGRSALAGFLSGEKAGNIISARFEPGLVGINQNRLWVGNYTAQSIYRPPVMLQSGLGSEVLYLDFFADSPFAALEDYAEAIAKWNRVQTWQGPIPSGWNSWGEYYDRINERIILENLDFAGKNFQPFGMRYFQIDDGYSPFWGDWEADPDRFPNGMKWLADQIRAQGMIPGIWIAPFDADINSGIFHEHPDWFLPRKGLGPRFLVSDNLRVLDLSKPEVQEHLRKVIRKYVREWGYRWIKVDFAYHLLSYQEVDDGSETVPEIYREGMRIIKEEAGPEVFVLGIGVVGFNYGLVDGQRLSLDNMPAWSNQKSFFHLRNFGFAQGLVPTARIASRRYWLNYHLWINHPDLIFFNNDRRFALKQPPLTFEESICFASLVGISGGIVKIGDKLVEMTDQEVAVIRKLLPVYPKSGRPLDLFEKETPEIWHLPIKTDFEQWDLVGLFNWGKNWINRREIPEQTRTFSVKMSELGLDPSRKYLVFDFWNENFLGIFQEEIKLELAPHTSRVLAVRELKAHPWFLSYNRHLTQGAIEIKKMKWDDAGRVLTGIQEAVPGYEYHLYFYQPEGFKFSGAEVAGADFKSESAGKVITLIFIPKTKNQLTWRIKFQNGVNASL